MARGQSPEREAERAEYRRFGEALAAYLGARGDLEPGFAKQLALSMTALDARGRPPSLAGLRMATQDFLEMTRHLHSARVTEVDAFLRERGAVSLTEMRRKVWRQIPKILGRGRIRTEAEYYLLAERVNDVDGTDLGAEERARAAELVAAYEASRRAPAAAGGHAPPLYR